MRVQIGLTPCLLPAHLDSTRVWVKADCIARFRATCFISRTSNFKCPRYIQPDILQDDGTCRAADDAVARSAHGKTPPTYKFVALMVCAFTNVALTVPVVPVTYNAVALMSPFTSSLVVGDVVPMPTLLSYGSCPDWHSRL